jgi:L-asparaginase
MQSIIIMNGEGWPGITKGTEMLRANSEPLDIVEESIKLTESEARVRTVGFGGAPNALGTMQLDASIMDGDTLQTGAVGAIEEILHPISVTRELIKRLPHVMLVGDGAKRFANECGFKSEEILSPEAQKDYLAWREKSFKENLIDIFKPSDGKGSHGTVICLVRNNTGRICGGVSTSGWDYKYPGRLGDSPIIGAGLYVDSRYGGAACTHTGENAIRTSLAHSVILYMKKGASVREAVAEGMADLSALKGGYQGQVVIYAIDKNGEHCVARRLKEGRGREYIIFTDSIFASSGSNFEKRETEFLG